MSTIERRSFLKVAAVASLPAIGLAVACGGDDKPAENAPVAGNDPDEAPPTANQQAQAGTATRPAATQPAATAAATATTLAATPACVDDDDVTIALTEGPFFTPNSPERTTVLESGMKGTVLKLSGFVMTTDCKPVAKALVDLWQTDDAGEYDNSGYRMRGHTFTDAKGAWTMETIVPGLYPGRTRHIHVKAQAPGKPVLTTQFFFPGESGNARDGIYKKELELTMGTGPNGSRTGAYTIVLNV